MTQSFANSTPDGINYDWQLHVFNMKHAILVDPSVLGCADKYHVTKSKTAPRAFRLHACKVLM